MHNIHQSLLQLRKRHNQKNSYQVFNDTIQGRRNDFILGQAHHFSPFQNANFLKKIINQASDFRLGRCLSALPVPPSLSKYISVIQFWTRTRSATVYLEFHLLFLRRWKSQKLPSNSDVVFGCNCFWLNSGRAELGSTGFQGSTQIFCQKFVFSKKIIKLVLPIIP